MPSPSQQTIVGLLIGIVLVAAIVVGAIALVGIQYSGEQGSGLPPQFDYDLGQYRKVAPALIGARKVGEIPLAMSKPYAIAVDPKDAILVGGDKAIHVFASDGRRQREIPLEDSPQCLAVGGDHHEQPGRIYVGMKDHVETFDADGKQVAKWESLGERAVLTSIAVAENEVFVADAGNRLVWRYDPSGKPLGKIGGPDDKRDIPLVVPSPYLDCAMGPDGLLRVVNPGAHRIEAYTTDGLFEEPLTWGKPTTGIDGFCGCCNPAAIAILPDGRIVTGEKGLPRVKVYSSTGRLDFLVADPDTLSPNAAQAEETRAPHKPEPVDLAADSKGRILVLDRSGRRVLIFEHNRKETDE
jgi:sugar lactone lactonase YvrE